MGRIALILAFVLVPVARGQDAPPEHEQLRLAAEESNRLSRKSAAELAARHDANAKRVADAEEALKRPAEDLAQLQAAYTGGAGATRVPSKDEVLIRLRELTRLTNREAFDARLARLRDEADAVERIRDRAATALASLDETFNALQERAKEVPVSTWRAIAAERRDALTAVRTGAEDVLADLARLRSLWSRRHEALRRALYLLRNENLLLRGDSEITMPALRQGADDLRQLPSWIGRAAGGTGRYLADPAHRGALLRFAGVYLLAAVFLFLLGRWVRRQRARAARSGVAARIVRVTIRLLTAVAVAVLLFLVPFLAGRMLPEIPVGASAWLKDLAYVIGGFWLLRAIVHELLVSHGDGAVPASAAARWLARGLHVLLYLSLGFVPILCALDRFEYGNRGVLEFVHLVYQGLLGLVLLVLLRRRFLLSLVSDTQTRGAKALRTAIVWLQPVAILLVPTLWLLAALRYDILAGLITRFATSAIVVAILGVVLYRLALSLTAVWLGSVYPPDRGGVVAARHEAALGGSGFVLGVVFLFVALAAFLSFAGSDLDEMRSFFDQPLPLQSGEGRVVTWWNLILAIVLLWFFLALSSRAKAVVRELVLARTKMDKGVQYTTSMLLGYFLVGTGFYLSIREVFDLTNLGYIVAALSVGIGFGMQEIISNFVSGLILLFERPLKVGDLVNVGDRMGVVKNINIRATTVLTNDNIYLLVPNRDFIGQTVTNFAHKDPKMRLRVPLGVSYSSDTARVREVLLEVAAAHDSVLKYPAPDVYFMGFGDSSLNFDLLAWIYDPPEQHRIASQLYFAIFQAFREHGIEIPFPQRDLHLRSATAISIAGTAPHDESDSREQ